MKIRTADGAVLQVPDGYTQDQISDVVDDYMSKNGGFLAGVKHDLGARAEKYGNILQSQEPALGKAYLAAGQSAGLANDVWGRVVSAATPDFIGEPLAKAGAYVLNSIGNLPSFGGGTIGERIPQELGKLEEDHPDFAEYAKATGNLGLLLSAPGIAQSKRVSSAAAKTTQVAKSAGKEAVENAGGLLSKALPNIDDQTAVLASKAMDDYGIPLKFSQVVDSQPLKILDSVSEKLPFQGTQAFDAKQATAFNKAVAKTIGESADQLTPDVLLRARDRIGGMFDEALKGRVLRISDDFKNNMDRILLDADEDLTKDLFDVVSRKYKNIISDVADGSQVNAEKLASARSSIMRTLKNTRNDSAPYLREIASALDDELFANSPDDIKELIGRARNQYKNLKTIENLAAKSPDGDISPALLLNQVMKANPKFAYGQGGDLADLAKIGQKFLKQQVPDSGSIQRGMYGMGLLGGGAYLGVDPLSVGAGISMGRGLNELNRNQSLLRKSIGNNSLVRLPKKSGLIEVQ